MWTFGQEGEEAETVDVELAEETYRTIGKFGYLESMEYIMENTYGSCDAVFILSLNHTLLGKL